MQVEILPTDKLKLLAEEALAIQNACNLCGLSQRFAEVMVELNKNPYGTDFTNQHPITKLWVDKLCHLSGMEYKSNYDYYSQVHELTQGRPITVTINLH